MIFSGADKLKLEETFNNLPVWLAAENGMYLRSPIPRENEDVSLFLPDFVSLSQAWLDGVFLGEVGASFVGLTLIHTYHSNISREA